MAQAMSAFARSPYSDRKRRCAGILEYNLIAILQKLVAALIPVVEVHAQTIPLNAPLTAERSPIGLAEVIVFAVGFVCGSAIVPNIYRFAGHQRL
jgi:hypothetical protein